MSHVSDEMVPLHLFANNQRLSASPLMVAQQICRDAAKMVKDRNSSIEVGTFDAKFALPDANWLYDATNEFVHAFRRLVECNPSDMNRLRGFSAVFSGYSSFAVSPNAGLTTSDLAFDDAFDHAVADRVRMRNTQPGPCLSTLEE